MRWRSLDLAEGTLHVTHQRVRPQRVDYERHESRLSALKTGRARRSIPMTASLVQALREHRLRSPASGPNDLVFVHENGTPIAHRGLQHALKLAAKAAQIESSQELGRVSPHSLRRSLGSHLVLLGMSLTEISSLLGHASPTTTASAYLHEFRQIEPQKARRARVAEAFGRVYDMATPAPEDAASDLALAA